MKDLWESRGGGAFSCSVSQCFITFVLVCFLLFQALLLQAACGGRLM
jgi:hypothetical protein